jgi:uncharacterized oxidoreductase
MSPTAAISWQPCSFAIGRRGGDLRIKAIEMTQVVLITGGTSGIGLGLAEAFMRQGVSVVVCGRGEVALGRFSSSHPDSLAIKADVTLDKDRTAMLDAVENRFGRLDILVNNAGSFVERNFAVGTDATQGLDQEVALNLIAPIVNRPGF